uniref:Uncharacterized protein n=1 Tax=Arundo donax TaxID=35708 RepID=A0A0A9TE69_ARUDO
MYSMYDCNHHSQYRLSFSSSPRASHKLDCTTLTIYVRMP